MCAGGSHPGTVRLLEVMQAGCVPVLATTAPREAFASLLAGTHEGVTTLVDQLWALFDPNHCGLVNMLEVLAALAIVSCCCA